MNAPRSEQPKPVRVTRFAAAPDLANAIEAFHQWLATERRASPHTIAAYGRDLAIFLAFIAEHRGAPPDLAGLATLQAADFRAFIAMRSGQSHPLSAAPYVTRAGTPSSR